MTRRHVASDHGGLVTLHLWEVTTAGIPAALGRMAVGRGRRRRPDGMTFGKLVGTGSASTFSPRDADPWRWGLVAAWRDRASLDAAERAAPLLTGWRRHAVRTSRAVLLPLSCRGSWAGQRPFSPVPADGWSGPVAALTRARLRWHAARDFRRAVPPVAAAAGSAPGLMFAVGFGEAPVGLQGTFSLWSDAASLRRFAYGSPDHRLVVSRTATRRWYAEELFARFAVLSADPPLLPNG